MQAFILLNRASPNPSVSEAEEAKEIISDLEHLGLAQTIIRNRIVFRKTARDGLAVPDLRYFFIG